MNTRVAVPLTQEAYEAVSFLSEISGRSRGKVLAEAIEMAVPSLIRTASAYRHALSVEGEERAAILEAFNRAEQHLLDALTHVEGFPFTASQGSVDCAVRDPERAVRAADPPGTNRGVPTGGKGGQHEV